MSPRAVALLSLLAYRPGASPAGDVIETINVACRTLTQRLATPIEARDYAGIASVIAEFVATVDVDGVTGWAWYVISREIPVIRMLANAGAWRIARDAIEVMRCRAVCAIVRDLVADEQERAEDAALDASATP